MADSNVTLVGNAVRDPEVRYTPSGATIVTFGIAVNRRWQNRQTQEWEEQVSFFDVKAWGGLGENIAESIQKGTRVVVTGRLEQRSWETESGDRRSKVEIVADEVAPSLRWATAQVQRIERQGGGNYSGGSGDFRPPAPQAGGGAPAPRSYDNSGSNYSEEPF